MGGVSWKGKEAWVKGGLVGVREVDWGGERGPKVRRVFWWSGGVVCKLGSPHAHGEVRGWLGLFVASDKVVSFGAVNSPFLFYLFHLIDRLLGWK